MPPEINPAGENFIDPGLGGFLEKRLEFEHLATRNFGKHKVPTVRNVDKRPFPEFVKAFGHNGFFKSLKEIVHFYNTRDVLPECPEDFDGVPGETCWPAPEVPANLNTQFVGDLGLTDAEEDAVVAFMETLSDGFEIDDDDDDDEEEEEDDDDDDEDDDDGKDKKDKKTKKDKA